MWKFILLILFLVPVFATLRGNQTRELTLDSNIPEPFKCISIYGLETNLRNTVCSWSHPAEHYIDKVHELGFNTLRVPISLQYVVENDYHILDNIINHADQLGMMVIMDFHRVGNSRQEENPDKGIQEYNGISNRDEFMNSVMKIMTRYSKNKSVVGLNSWNEYTGMDVSYKRDWDIQFFNKIEAAFPNRFVYFTTGLLWGGIVSGYSLEDQPWAHKLIYSTHKYHFSGTANRGDWDASFGNAYPANKLIVGEWGFRDPEDMWFGRDFSQYLVEKGIYNQCFWTIAHSGDTGGLWYDDCENINWAKYDIIKKVLV